MDLHQAGYGKTAELLPLQLMRLDFSMWQQANP